MSALSIIQIVVSLLLIVAILLQERSSGLSGIFGGDSDFYHTRRGLEKIVFWSTIVLVIAFGALSIYSSLVI